ncbi:hypothetical protein B0H19DRAFT_1370295 [Mycena capillaripes]|nr:hypothetical protein B0H19DRAFT_1370295 [Mycena capillaripes]
MAMQDTEMADWVDVEPPPSSPVARTPILAPATNLQTTKASRRAVWDSLLPMLEEPLARYRLGSYGQRPPTIPSLVQYECRNACNRPISARIQCLYITNPETVHVVTCSCMPMAVLLVEHGVFPVSPIQPRTGVSIELLEIYRALFERSCDAITALAAALHTIYDRRGFKVVSEKNKGALAQDPFRTGLGRAVQWYSNLRTKIQDKVSATLAAVEKSLFPSADVESVSAASDASDALDASGSPIPISTPTPQPASETENGAEPAPESPTQAPHSSETEGLNPGRAHRILREHCPACFGLETWGRPLSEGGDVQFGSDGCFSYRHLQKAGDGNISYDPSYFVSKQKENEVRDRIASARKKSPAKFTPPIPSEAIDACEASWDAANEKKKKVDSKRYDASGVFVMTCRHSQVLFLCDIDTPGEQQQYVVALLEEVNSLLPCKATMVQCYDVGCVTDHSMNLFPILTPGLRGRVVFVINAMHAYGHQWVCQLVYNPRLRRGMGLTDAKGVERFWFRIRKLIGITRNQWNSRCIWMIDQYAAFLNEEGRDSLGNWIFRQQMKNLTNKRNTAVRTLRECRVPEAELRHNWAEQKAAQSSIRAHAPACLRRELDKVLNLQTQIDVVDKSISEAKQSITGSGASVDCLALLRSLEGTHDILSNQAQALYASLNIQEEFPDLQNLPLEFVRTLLLMRDLKINIHKRAVGTFYEWENLDRAVGGRKEALEHANMSAWIDQELVIVRKAIETLADQSLALLLEHRLQHLLHLRITWAPGLTTHIAPQEASFAAQEASLAVQEVPAHSPSGDSTRRQPLRTAAEPLATSEDYITTPDELESGAMSDPEDVITVQEMLENSHLDEDSSVLDSDSVQFVTVWKCPENLHVDGRLLHAVQEANHLAFVDCRRGVRVIVGLQDRPSLRIEPEDLDHVTSSNGWLNGFVLTGLAAAFLNLFGHPTSASAANANRCAVLSTYDLPRARYKASDDEIWRHTHCTKFWEKDLWLIPIHRPDEEH